MLRKRYWKEGIILPKTLKSPSQDHDNIGYAGCFVDLQLHVNDEVDEIGRVGWVGLARLVKG